MPNFLDVLEMMGTHEERKVECFEQDGLVVDTCAVTNVGDFPYETGIKDSHYGGDGGWVIVECYKTKEAATLGHTKWVKVMTATKPPDELIDVSMAKENAGAPEAYPRRDCTECGAKEE